MCGINGIVKKNSKVFHDEVVRMNDALEHRGPDGEGVYTFENIGIGHRRLSIIDLSLGKQPMADESGDVYITFNGEIYNYLELKEALLARGHRFRTNSDTEVILYAYKEWGKMFLPKLRGMFAFALVDKSKKQILLARDYLGIKPLVYYLDDDMFAFSSEIQGLKKISNLDLTYDFSALNEYFRLAYIPAPKTAYQRIRKLLPGHFITIDFNMVVTEQKPFYTFEFYDDNDKSEEQVSGEIQQILSESVEKHLLSDVPYGAFLSGGIDSTLIVQYMSQICDQKVKTFSIGFENNDYDESQYSEFVSKKLGTEHYQVTIGDESLEALSDIIRCHGEPAADNSDISTYFVSKLARECGVKVVLSGDAGDELFAGYKTYLEWQELIDFNQSFSTSVKDKVVPTLHKFFPQRFPSNTVINDLGLNRWINRNSYMPFERARNIWKSDFQESLCKDIPRFTESYFQAQSFSKIHQAQYMDINTYLPYDILLKVDAVSMANSIEVRTPFIDREVIEYALKIPAEMNVKKLKGYGYSGKEVLKGLLDDYPASFRYRKKQGFATPIKYWLYDTKSRAYELKQNLLSKDAYLYEFLDSYSVQNIVNGESFGNVWQLICFEEWLRQEKAL